MKKTLSALFVSVACAFAAPPVANADPAGDQALALVDVAINKPSTQYLEYVATVKAPDKADRTVELAIWLKGEKRLSEFLAPSDVKGTKVLILSPTQMYIYLPAYKKVRRIASHVTDQGFMGMHFTQDDFSVSHYGKYYRATVLGEDATTKRLALTPKPDAPEAPPYARIELTLEKARNLPLEMKYFSDSGKHLKTEKRSAYTCEGAACAPSQLEMIDHQKGGASTTLARRKWKVNETMSDDLFSKRSLER